MTIPANNPSPTPEPARAGGASGERMSGMARPRKKRDEIDAVEQEVLNAVDACGFPPASRFALRVALEEAMVNAFLHGHRGLS
ncbi:MAG: ATP-binding protein, partial [Phycisphaerales bacterium]|nr:ATP-binding protein [Phycisphaerales bacterium]